MRSSIILNPVNTAVNYNDKADPLFDIKIESIVRGLTPDCKKSLQKSSKENALTIIEYIISMQTEINLSPHYQKDLIILLYRFSKSNNHECLSYHYFTQHAFDSNIEPTYQPFLVLNFYLSLRHCHFY